MMSATEGCDEESRQHRVTGHSPNPGAAAGRKGFRPRRVTLVELSTIESETSAASVVNWQVEHPASLILFLSSFLQSRFFVDF